MFALCPHAPSAMTLCKQEALKHELVSQLDPLRIVPVGGASANAARGIASSRLSRFAVQCVLCPTIP